MTTESTEEEKKAKTFLIICGVIALMMVGAIAWMSLQPGAGEEEGEDGEWVALGKSGLMDVSYKVEDVKGATVFVVRRSGCDAGTCQNMVSRASAMMGDAKGASEMPSVFETDIEVDCTAEQFQEGDIRVYDSDGAVIISEASGFAGEWIPFEKFGSDSLEYHGMMKMVCEREAESGG